MFVTATLQHGSDGQSPIALTVVGMNLTSDDIVDIEAMAVKAAVATTSFTDLQARTDEVKLAMEQFRLTLEELAAKKRAFGVPDLVIHENYEPFD